VRRSVEQLAFNQVSAEVPRTAPFVAVKARAAGSEETKIGPLVAALSREETLRGDEHPKHSGRNV
jgi:hypothetical protein